jgi:hypothetical protein
VPLPKFSIFGPGQLVNLTKLQYNLLTSTIPHKNPSTRKSSIMVCFFSSNKISQVVKLLRSVQTYRNLLRAARSSLIYFLFFLLSDRAWPYNRLYILYVYIRPVAFPHLQGLPEAPWRAHPERSLPPRSIESPDVYGYTSNCVGCDDVAVDLLRVVELL